MKRGGQRARERGVTVLELLATLSVAAVQMGTALPALHDLDNPLQDGAAQVISFVKRVRATAMATTTAYTIRPVSPTRLGVRAGTTCAATSTVPDDQVLNLPSGARISDLSWSVCFSSRGIADSNVDIPMRDGGGEVKVVRVYLGGTARTL